MTGFTLDEACGKVQMPLYPRMRLEACYGRPERLYRNMVHIERMLGHVPKNHPEAEIVIDAVLFHDIVVSSPHPRGLDQALCVAEYLFYNTKTLAFDTPFGLGGDGSLEYERRVIEAVTATSRHQEDQAGLGEASKLVLDLDLCEFSLPWDQYLACKKQMEAEAELLGADPKERLYFLKKILERKNLYYIKTEWEQAARSNIQRDLASGV
jgi:predicted metal-dependent HD superfamily phosphohydrolase